MRQIKFRGRDIVTGEWVYGCLLNNLWVYNEYHSMSGKAVTEIIVAGEASDWETVEENLKITVNPHSVGEWTGLHDKNGKEIYEEDFLYKKNYEDSEEESGFEESRVRVSFKNGAFGWIGETPHWFFPFVSCPLEDYEVCGNIWENPEWIKS